MPTKPAKPDHPFIALAKRETHKRNDRDHIGRSVESAMNGLIENWTRAFRDGSSRMDGADFLVDDMTDLIERLTSIQASIRERLEVDHVESNGDGTASKG